MTLIHSLILWATAPSRKACWGTEKRSPRTADGRGFARQPGVPDGREGWQRRCQRLLCNGQPTHNRALRRAKHGHLRSYHRRENRHANGRFQLGLSNTCPQTGAMRPGVSMRGQVSNKPKWKRTFAQRVERITLQRRRSLTRFSLRAGQDCVRSAASEGRELADPPRLSRRGRADIPIRRWLRPLFDRRQEPRWQAPVRTVSALRRRSAERAMAEHCAGTG